MNTYGNIVPKAETKQIPINNKTDNKLCYIHKKEYYAIILWDEL